MEAMNTGDETPAAERTVTIMINIIGINTEGSQEDEDEESKN